MGKLVDELCFYRKYHYNNVNVAIHVVCIPMILLTSMYILTAVKVPAAILQETSLDPKYYDYFNLSNFLGFFYAAYYTQLDAIYGVPYGAFIVYANLKFSKLAPYYGTDGNRVAWGIWTFSWIAQFIGHGKFEHRAPALLDSLIQALVLAPFFAVFEVSHFLGIRTHILNDIDARVRPDIEKFHAARRSKSQAAAAR